MPSFLHAVQCYTSEQVEADSRSSLNPDIISVPQLQELKRNMQNACEGFGNRSSVYQQQPGPWSGQCASAINSSSATCKKQVEDLGIVSSSPELGTGGGPQLQELQAKHAINRNGGLTNRSSMRQQRPGPWGGQCASAACPSPKTQMLHPHWASASEGRLSACCAGSLPRRTRTHIYRGTACCQQHKVTAAVWVHT